MHILEHSFLEAGCHAERKPKQSCGETQREELRPGHGCQFQMGSQETASTSQPATCMCHLEGDPPDWVKLPQLKSCEQR